MLMGKVNDMGHRGRVVVELGAPSEHVLVIMPKGYERLGLVSVGSGDPGVLARITGTGEYVQLDVRGMTPLDRRKVEAAIEAAALEPRSVGRPRKSHELREVFSVSWNRHWLSTFGDSGTEIVGGRDNVGNRSPGSCLCEGRDKRRSKQPRPSGDLRRCAQGCRERRYLFLDASCG